MEPMEYVDGLVAQGLSDGQILQMLTGRRNERAHRAAAASQPAVAVGVPAAEWVAVRAYATRPRDESDGIAPDVAAGLVKDALAGGNAKEALFALIRMWRVAYFQMPHLGEM